MESKAQEDLENLENLEINHDEIFEWVVNNNVEKLDRFAKSLDDGLYYLQDLKFNLGEDGGNGASLLHVAAMQDTYKSWDIASSIINSREEAEKKKQTIQFLIDTVKIPVDTTNEWNETPLMLAVKFNQYFFIKYLIDNFGANYEIVSERDGRTPLMTSLTSNLDFAHAVCDDLAFYFNPFDVQSILDVMKYYDKDKEDLERRIIKGKSKANAIPNWKEVFIKFNSQIEIVLNKN
jgi:hypothetical protein